MTYVVAPLEYPNNYRGGSQYPTKTVEARHWVAKTAKTCRAALCYYSETVIVAAAGIACDDFHSPSLPFSSVSALMTRDIPYRIFLGKSGHI